MGFEIIDLTSLKSSAVVSDFRMISCVKKEKQKKREDKGKEGKDRDRKEEEEKEKRKKETRKAKKHLLDFHLLSCPSMLFDTFRSHLSLQVHKGGESERGVYPNLRGRSLK